VLSNGDRTAFQDTTGVINNWYMDHNCFTGCMGKYYWEMLVSQMADGDEFLYGIRATSTYGPNSNPFSSQYLFLSGTGGWFINATGSDPWVTGSAPGAGAILTGTIPVTLKFFLDTDNWKWYAGIAGGAWFGSGNPDAGTGFLASGRADQDVWMFTCCAGGTAGAVETTIVNDPNDFIDTPPASTMFAGVQKFPL